MKVKAIIQITQIVEKEIEIYNGPREDWFWLVQEKMRDDIKENRIQNYAILETTTELVGVEEVK